MVELNDDVREITLLDITIAVRQFYVNKKQPPLEARDHHDN